MVIAREVALIHDLHSRTAAPPGEDDALEPCDTRHLVLSPRMSAVNDLRSSSAMTPYSDSRRTMPLSMGLRRVDRRVGVRIDQRVHAVLILKNLADEGARYITSGDTRQENRRSVPFHKRHIDGFVPVVASVVALTSRPRQEIRRSVSRLQARMACVEGARTRSWRTRQGEDGFSWELLQLLLVYADPIILGGRSRTVIRKGLRCA